MSISAKNSQQHIHILGICGTFMGGIARLAIERGYKVSGQDSHIYPPMSDQLQQLGIEVTPLDDVNAIKEPNQPDKVIIGNALSRGHPVVEAVLNSRLPYISGAQWLAENILFDQWVLAVSGTHGKTTTSSMLAWILEYAGLMPGFLIGGVPENFGVSARMSKAGFFVLEADEYDTAFFDKRSKFVHFRPRTAIINNIEYDHADIFSNIGAIQTQFHHFVRTIPSEGLLITPNQDALVEQTLQKGCWTPRERFGCDDHSSYWNANILPSKQGQLDGSHFAVYCDNKLAGEVKWQLIGKHNVNNALAAITAARHVGIPVHHSLDALGLFKNTKRRLEKLASIHNIHIYDDFAHHPSAIKTTLDGLRRKVETARIIAVFEPRSNSMKMKVHNDILADSFSIANRVFFKLPCEMNHGFNEVIEQLAEKVEAHHQIEQLIERLLATAQSGDHIVIMSNGSFDGLHQQLIQRLNNPE